MRTVSLRSRVFSLLLPLALLACGNDRVTDSGDGQPLPEQLTIKEVLYQRDGSAVVVLLRPAGPRQITGLYRRFNGDRIVPC